MDMKKVLASTVSAINRMDTRLLVFAVIFLNTFTLMLYENEEHYLAFPKAFMNPDWIPGAVSLKDVQGSRIIFDIIIGWMLNFASFEQVAIFGRTLVALLFAFPLARIFKKFRFSNLSVLFILQIICVVTHQSFFAKEWIFGSLESKVVSYVFIFFSLAFLFEDRCFLSVIFAGLAVYFHILVGGWYSIILFVYLLASRTSIKKILIYGLTFACLVSPIMIYLAKTYLADNPAVIGGLQISQIYTLRVAHHVDIIRQLGRFGSSAQTGVILSFFCCILCLRILKTGNDPLLLKAALLNVILFFQQFLSLFIALFDKTGGFLKYYPYRTSSISFFLMFIILGIFLRENFFLKSQDIDIHPSVKSPLLGRSYVITLLMLLCIFSGLGYKIYENTASSMELLFPSRETAARLSLYDWIKNNTPHDAVFMDLNRGMRDDLDFIRRTERDSFSVYKFLPTTNRLIYDWYMRHLEKQKVLDDITYISELRERYRIDYIVSKMPLHDKNLQAVYSNDFYFLYK
jgi:hypothetical protein